MAFLVLCRVASADEVARLRVDWQKLADILRDETSFAQGRFRGATATGTTIPVWRAEAQDPGAGAEPGWIGMSPRLSIVARDWGASQRLWGDLGPTDLLRLSRSSRMVVTRVRLGHGRIAPFAQVGLGQWRVDPEVLVTMPNDVEVAAQVGAGFELHLAPRVVLALEMDGTTLYRESHEPQMVACPRMWGSLLAGRALF